MDADFTSAHGRRGQEDESSFEIPEEDIESRDPENTTVQTPGLRQEFDVIYIRKPKANRWTATTERRGLLYSGVKAKGAVGYTTARWEGKREGDENHGTVTVLVECDQTMCDSHSRVRPTAWPVMTATARQLADRMFRTSPSRRSDRARWHSDHEWGPDWKRKLLDQETDSRPLVIPLRGNAVVDAPASHALRRTRRAWRTAKRREKEQK